MDEKDTLHHYLRVRRDNLLGHADILRELIDGTAGQRAADPNLTVRSPEEWRAHRAAIEAAARKA